MFLAPLHLVARSRGRKLVAEWMEGVSPFRAIQDILKVAANADLLELCASSRAAQRKARRLADEAFTRCERALRPRTHAER